MTKLYIVGMNVIPRYGYLVTVTPNGEHTKISLVKNRIDFETDAGVMWHIGHTKIILVRGLPGRAFPRYVLRKKAKVPCTFECSSYRDAYKVAHSGHPAIPRLRRVTLQSI
jgi:hypothetical protein